MVVRRVRVVEVEAFPKHIHSRQVRIERSTELLRRASSSSAARVLHLDDVVTERVLHAPGEDTGLRVRGSIAAPPHQSRVMQRRDNAGNAQRGQDRGTRDRGEPAEGEVREARGRVAEGVQGAESRGAAGFGEGVGAGHVAGVGGGRTR